MPSRRPRPLADGWERELERLLLWDRSLRRGDEDLSLVAALSSCEVVRARLGLSGDTLHDELRKLLPEDDSGRDDEHRYLFAVRALMGLIEPTPTWESAVPGADGLRLGDVVLYKKKPPAAPMGYVDETVASLGYHFPDSVLARKAYVHALFALNDVTGIRRGSKATRLMVRALGQVLGLSADGALPPTHVERVRPHGLLLKQLVNRINEPAVGYPDHLTPDVLATSLRVSNFTPQHSSRFLYEQPGLYVDVRSLGGAPALEEVARERRTVVLGNPGGGKSTVLSASVIAAARSGSPATSARLSSVAARGVAVRTADAALALLVRIQTEDLGIPLPDDETEFVKELATNPDALVALDGLDEVHPDDLDRVHNLLRLLSDLPGRVVISSRIAGYETPPGQWHEVVVDALTRPDADRFIASWFQGENQGAARARAALENAVGETLAETPVLLGIIATVAEEDDVPLVVAQLYDHYVSHYLRGKWRHRSQWLPVSKIPAHLAIARTVAWTMATGATGRSDGTRWSDTVTYRTLTNIDHDRKPHISKTLVERHGLLVPHGRHRSELHQEYRWLHRTVHEHLVGGHLADLVDRGNALPEAVLMGPTQWHVPLRHMIGLLDGSAARRVFDAMAHLKRGGDPGGVIESLEYRLAAGLPTGSPIRAELAQSAVSRGDWLHGIQLDPSIINENYVDAIEQHDDGALVMSFHLLDECTPTHSVAQRLVDALSIARTRCADDVLSRVDNVYEQAVVWLSRYDPDEALDALLAAATSRYIDPPYMRWKDAPSRQALSSALFAVAMWKPEPRLRYLDFLAQLGTELDNYLAPEGPLRPEDVHVAMALWNARRDRDASDPSPYPLPDHVVDALLSGAYGDDLAYETAARDDLRGRNKDASGVGPSLAQVVTELYQVDANSGPTADPTAAAHTLASLTLSDIRAIEKLPSALAAARVCVENASRVPLDLALQVQWTLASLNDAPPRVPVQPSLFWPFAAVTDAMMRAFAARGSELTAAILLSDAMQWVIRPPDWADYSAAYALNRANALSVNDILALTQWAAAAGGKMLRFVTRDSITEDFISELYQRSPDAVRVNLSEIAETLARLGHLATWRGRLIALSD